MPLQVMDKDVGTDTFLGIVTYPISKLVPEETTEVTLNLKSALDTNLVKDKKDRGTVTLKVSLSLVPDKQSAHVIFSP